MTTTTWSELAALVGIITTVCTMLGGIGMLFLSSKFVSKKTHYVEKDQLWAGINKAEARIAELEKESELAKQPIMTMQKSVEDMQRELTALVLAVTTMDKSVSGAIHAIDTRVSVIESKATRRKSAQ